MGRLCIGLLTQETRNKMSFSSRVHTLQADTPRATAVSLLVTPVTIACRCILDDKVHCLSNFILNFRILPVNGIGSIRIVKPPTGFRRYMHGNLECMYFSVEDYHSCIYRPTCSQPCPDKGVSWYMLLLSSDLFCYDCSDVLWSFLVLFFIRHCQTV